jgi:hypothetical protein
MELLPEPKFKDRVHYMLAFMLTAICGALGLIAAHQIRVVILLTSTLATFRRRGFRVADYVGWFVLGIAWMAYAMKTEHALRTGVTEARIRRERGRSMPERVADHKVQRWLWQHDLDITVRRFLRHILIPLGIFLIALLISTILQSLAVT